MELVLRACCAVSGAPMHCKCDFPEDPLACEVAALCRRAFKAALDKLVVNPACMHFRAATGALGF